jgi:hypothetical protein
MPAMIPRRLGATGLAGLTLWLVASCAAPERKPGGGDGGTGGGAEAAAPADAVVESRAPSPCRPPGVSRSPTSIPEVVTLVNALPRPLTLTCFLESLDRPLRVSATNGVISLQPARGTRSPRLFLHIGALVASIVPDGPGAPLVEFGEFIDDENTIKGEIAFPMDGPLDPATPYKKILDGGGTVCRGCHRAEARVETIDVGPAFASAALRPVPSSLVSLERVRQEHETCDPAAEPERCAIYRALFEHGEVIPWQFPASLPTIFY